MPWVIDWRLALGRMTDSVMPLQTPALSGSSLSATTRLRVRLSHPRWVMDISAEKTSI
jgi:hypothetical protein